MRQMLHEQRGQVDPESERKEIRGQLRLMRETTSAGCMEGRNTSTGKRSAP